MVVHAALRDEEVEEFIAGGAVRLKGAFPRDVADECRQILWTATGCDEHDPSSWTKPVVRIGGRADPPFSAAINTERLRSAFDQLAGLGRWVPRHSIGTFPIRFPVDEAPGDDGWHIEATGAAPTGEPVVDPQSTERLLLLLFLFSDVGPDDAPTRIRRASHLFAARLLHQDPGPMDFFEVARELDGATRHLPEILATGGAGDVWLCHPYLVHAAQRHRGQRVRFMAQPPLAGVSPIDPTRPRAERSPVDEAVYRGLAD